MGANFGIAGLDWQQRVNWDRMRKYRLERARERMKAHGLGAMICMYDENVRYLTGTLTPGWNRLKPGLRYAMLCGDDPPVLFEQGDLGFQIERHSPWIPKENVKWSYAWIKGAAGPASRQQVGAVTQLPEIEDENRILPAAVAEQVGRPLVVSGRMLPGECGRLGRCARGALGMQRASQQR